MAGCRIDDKPLSEKIWLSLLTHMCVSRPRCVNTLKSKRNGHLKIKFCDRKVQFRQANINEVCSQNVQLTTNQHWPKEWFGAEQMMYDYLNNDEQFIDAYNLHPN